MSGAALALRPVMEEDCDLVLEWANDSQTRRMSFSTEPISADAHRRWFQRRLGDPRCLFYLVIRADGEPVGQVRFEREGGRDASVSLSIAPRWRGRGYAAQALRLATREAMAAGELRAVHAYIKPENAPSVRAFRRAGFGPPEPVDYRGSRALRMTRLA